MVETNHAEELIKACEHKKHRYEIVSLPNQRNMYQGALIKHPHFEVFIQITTTLLVIVNGMSRFAVWFDSMIFI